MKLSLRIIIILALLNLLIWGGLLRPETPRLTVTFLDVGEGDSAFIKFPYGGSMLIDGGPYSEFNSPKGAVLPYLRRNGVRKIDLVALTHSHSDHLGGLIPVMEEMRVGAVLDTGVPQASFLYARFLGLIEKKRIPFYVVGEGEEIAGFRGVRILILNPPARRFSGTESDLNNNSLVMKITFNRVDLLLCADIELKAEESLEGYGDLLSSEIIKVPHHGSSTSIHAPFLEMVSPAAGIISCGYGNPFGHPGSETLNAYKKLNTAIFRTDRNGAITIISDGVNYEVKTHRRKI